MSAIKLEAARVNFLVTFSEPSLLLLVKLRTPTPKQVIEAE